MQQSEIVLHIIKLVIGGGAAFVAIMLWPRTKDGAWMMLIAGTIINYAGIVYNILVSFGIIASTLLVAGTPLLQMLFAAVPGIFFIVAFIIMLTKK
jgi:hypothetical protein